MTDYIKNDSFCMMPWIHLHVSPTGVAAPCCISKSCSTPTGMGNANTERLLDLVNSEQMNQLRLDMLTGKKNDECANCYQYEEQGVFSPRRSSINDYYHRLDDVKNTNEDGSLSDFHMRYFDIRFSNICNFKCRTCGQEFSSQWEQENLRNNVSYAQSFPKNNNKEFLQDVIDQIEYMDHAYFAGGEPLIMEEHYILLEEMIRKGRTDIQLRYNTNFSNLKFKDKDLLGLWQSFKYPVAVYASIDHYGERAEYIRHGTDWGKVESNLLMAASLPYVNLQMNSVISVFNYLTFDEFYRYMIDLGIYTARSQASTVCNMSSPEAFTCHLLPPEYKAKGVESINNTIDYMASKNFQADKIAQLTNCNQWVQSRDTWEEQKDNFKEEINRVDNIRGEDFRKTFPELAPLLDL